MFNPRQDVLNSMFIFLRSAPLYPAEMKKNYIREIREARGWGLQELADAVFPPTTPQQISHLELGKRKLTQDWISRLANALECHKIDILEGPAKPGTGNQDEKELLQVYRGLSDGEKKMFSSMLKSLADVHAAENPPYSQPPAQKHKKAADEEN